MPGLVPPFTDEREGLLAYLRQQRDIVCNAGYGLTDEEARSTPTVSALSVGGIIKHVAQTETFWIELATGRYRSMSPEEGGRAYAEGMTMTSSDTLAGLIEAYRRVGEETEQALAGVDLGQTFEVPKAPWFPQDVKGWSVRWVLLHLIEETARHAGHADIIREAIDGATAFPLMAAAEGWPETPWVKPWHRANR